MARLIDADELKKNFQDELCKGIACAECSMQAKGFCRVERWIDIAPTIEAEPKHGRWIKDEYGIPHCSECGTINNTVYKNYCPNCGAKMSSEENHIDLGNGFSITANGARVDEAEDGKA